MSNTSLFRKFSTKLGLGSNSNTTNSNTTSNSQRSTPSSRSAAAVSAPSDAPPPAYTPISSKSVPLPTPTSINPSPAPASTSTFSQTNQARQSVGAGIVTGTAATNVKMIFDVLTAAVEDQVSSISTRRVLVLQIPNISILLKSLRIYKHSTINIHF